MSYFSFSRSLGRIAFWLALVVLTAPLARAQNVSGTVSGADGSPLPGVNVVVEGTFVGTTTDTQGRFELDVDFSDGPRTLAFSFTGYQTHRVSLEGPTTGLEVMLEPTVIQGVEVVVSASRIEESVLEAPVTVERVNYA